jgi:hypothetical protein
MAGAAPDMLRGDRTLGQIAGERHTAPTRLSQGRATELTGLPSGVDDE